MSGFHDNRSDAICFLNAAIVKMAIEKAKQVKVVFVTPFAGLADVNRGQDIKELIQNAKSMFENIDKFGVVVNKCEKGMTQEDIKEFVRENQLHPVNEQLNQWNENNQVYPKALGIQDDKDDILSMIDSLEG